MKTKGFVDERWDIQTAIRQQIEIEDQQWHEMRDIPEAKKARSSTVLQ